jgi:murein DD-endopeptidase MepM/ murein hydrolase activator NlpD
MKKEDEQKLDSLLDDIRSGNDGKIVVSKKINPQKLLPNTTKTDDQKSDDKTLKSIQKELVEIKNSVNAIVEAFKKQNQLAKSSMERQRQDKNIQRKKSREKSLESKSGAKNAGDKIEKAISPFADFFEKIMNFFKFILLGGFFKGLLNIIKNPKILLKPLQNIINSIVGFFNGIIKWIDDNVIGPIRTLIDYVNGGIKNIVNTINDIIKALPSWLPKPDLIDNPPAIPQIPNLPQIPEATFANSPAKTIPVVPQFEKGGEVQNVSNYNNVTNSTNNNVTNSTNNNVTNVTNSTNNITNNSIKDGSTVLPRNNSILPRNNSISNYNNVTNSTNNNVTNSTNNITNNSIKAGSTVLPRNNSILPRNNSINVNDLSFANGGQIENDTGLTITGLGKDTQLIAAQPGEVVINAKAAENYGVGKLLTINDKYGGPVANKPRDVASNKIKAMASGGYAGGKIKYFSVNGGGNKLLNSGQTYTYSDLRMHHSGPTTRRTDGYPKDYTLLHGTDLSSSPNADVPVPLDSEVIFKNQAGGYGNTVVVKNATGNMLFAHLSRMGNFGVGDKIKAGTIIGTQGSTGGNYADHLHMDAEPAGHEAFVNYITSGKPTFGSTSAAGESSSGEIETEMTRSGSLQIPSAENVNNGMNFLRSIGPVPGQVKSGGGVANTPNQKSVPSFSSIDPANPSLLVVKSIYNLVG